MATTTRIHANDLRPKQYDWILAIDPNCSETNPSANKSGTALLNTHTRALFVESYTFPELMNRFAAISTQDSVLILVEAGWLNLSNWHLHGADTIRSASKKGRDIGLNHQTGHLIVEMARSLNLPVEEIRPLSKHYSGKGGKPTHKDLSLFVTNLPHTTNEDERDAILLAYHRAGFPLSEDPKAQLLRILNK